MVEGEVIEVMGKIVSGLAGHQEDLVSFLSEKEKAGTEVKSMDRGARTSGSESHLCHSLAT